MCTSSAGLTSYGAAALESGFDDEAFKPQGSIVAAPNLSGPRILVIALLDGVGALMCARGRLPCVVQGYASPPPLCSLDSNPLARVFELRDVTKFDEKLISQLAASDGRRLDFVVLAGGSSCQDLGAAKRRPQRVGRFKMKPLL